jgi:hypothetical protein
MDQDRLSRIRLGAALCLLILLVAITGTPGHAQTSTPPQLEGCDIFPADNVWNVRVDSLPLDPNSAAYINTIGPSAGFHMDFGPM